MALRLFRTTGFSTLLMPGEARVAPHPARLVLRGSLWLALACNVGLWRTLAQGGDWRATLASVLSIGGASGVVLSLLGWRRTLKPALTLAFAGGALLATSLWSQGLPIATLWQEPPATWMPGWAAFTRWQALVLLFLLGVVPIVSAWNAHARRLSGPDQLRSNLQGMALGAALVVAGIFLAH